MLDYLNALACLILLCYLVPVALIMDWRYFWIHRIALWFVVIALGANALAPFESFLPGATWNAAFLHVILVMAATAWRREIWKFACYTFQIPRGKIADH